MCVVSPHYDGGFIFAGRPISVLDKRFPFLSLLRQSLLVISYYPFILSIFGSVLSQVSVGLHVFLLSKFVSLVNKLLLVCSVRSRYSTSLVAFVLKNSSVHCISTSFLIAIFLIVPCDSF